MREVLLNLTALHRTERLAQHILFRSVTAEVKLKLTNQMGKFSWEGMAWLRWDLISDEGKINERD